MPPDQLAAWLADRQGAIVGVDLAKRFDWKIGDRVPIQGTIWQPKAAARPGSSTSSACTTASRASTRRSSSSATTTSTRTGAPATGLVGWYIVKIADPSQAQAMGATFDDMFANSSAETKTTTEKGFVEGFAKQVGDIGAIMIAILVAVLFTMLLVAANTMAQSVRERTSEVGVLKTLGFSNGSILALVLGESVLIAAARRRPRPAAWRGSFVQQGDPTGGMLPIFVLPAPRRRDRRRR